jgi:hypothetical protein
MTDKPDGKYIKIRWKHSSPADPVLFYSEIDDDRWEIRKVEVFHDGHCEYASVTESTGGTVLGLAPIPPLEQIAEDPQFEPIEISHDHFERVWATRRNKQPVDD